MVGMGILAPVVALAAWTSVMLLWMYATRIPAMRALKLDLDRMVRDPEARLDKLLPPEIQWKSHNYNHLHEAPTVFYAVAIVLAIVGQGDGYNLWLGWLYVGLRIAHSLVQATINRIMLRFAIFAVSSLVLIVLTGRAAWALWW